MASRVGQTIGEMTAICRDLQTLGLEFNKRESSSLDINLASTRARLEAIRQNLTASPSIQRQGLLLDAAQERLKTFNALRAPNHLLRLPDVLFKLSCSFLSTRDRIALLTASQSTFQARTDVVLCLFKREFRTEIDQICRAPTSNAEALIAVLRTEVDPLIDSFTLGNTRQTLWQLQAKTLRLFFELEAAGKLSVAALSRETFPLCHLQRALDIAKQFPRATLPSSRIIWASHNGANFFRFGKNLISQQRYDDAIVFAHSLPEQIDQSRFIIEPLVRAFTDLNRFEEALLHAKSITHEYSRSDVLLYIVDRFILQNRFEDAQATAHLISAKDLSMRALRNIAKGYFALNQFDKGFILAKTISASKSDHVSRVGALHDLVEDLITLRLFNEAKKIAYLMPLHAICDHIPSKSGALRQIAQAQAKTLSRSSHSKRKC